MQTVPRSRGSWVQGGRTVAESRERQHARRPRRRQRSPASLKTGAARVPRSHLPPTTTTTSTMARHHLALAALLCWATAAAASAPPPAPPAALSTSSFAAASSTADDVLPIRDATPTLRRVSVALQGVDAAASPGHQTRKLRFLGLIAGAAIAKLHDRGECLIPGGPLCPFNNNGNGGGGAASSSSSSSATATVNVLSAGEASLPPPPLYGEADLIPRPANDAAGQASAAAAGSGGGGRGPPAFVDGPFGHTKAKLRHHVDEPAIFDGQPPPTLIAPPTAASANADGGPGGSGAANAGGNGVGASANAAGGGHAGSTVTAG